jgi:hypothetical protein
MSKYWTKNDRDAFLNAVRAMGGHASHNNYKNWNIHLGNICISFEESSGLVYLTDTNTQYKTWLHNGFRQWMREIMEGYE